LNMTRDEQMISVWCAIATPETDCTSDPHYIPTLIPFCDMVVGYRNVARSQFNGCEAFSEDAIKALEIVRDPGMRFRPRQHVWRVLKPGDVKEKRILEFESTSLDELLFRLAAEGYCE